MERKSGCDEVYHAGHGPYPSPSILRDLLGSMRDLKEVATGTPGLVTDWVVV